MERKIRRKEFDGSQRELSLEEKERAAKTFNATIDMLLARHVQYVITSNYGAEILGLEGEINITRHKVRNQRELVMPVTPTTDSTYSSFGDEEVCRTDEKNGTMNDADKEIILPLAQALGEADYTNAELERKSAEFFNNIIANGDLEANMGFNDQPVDHDEIVDILQVASIASPTVTDLHRVTRIGNETRES